MNVEDIFYMGISILTSIGVFFIIRTLIKNKLEKLLGVQKLIQLVSLAIVVIEASYLGFIFGVFDFAAEVIASMGLAFALITFALFNHLKNIVSGIALYLNPEINVGDRIKIENVEGKIIEINLMKTIAVTNDGKRIFIPNLKFSEEISILNKS